jgi:uncharacterized protein with HEPN domain
MERDLVSLLDALIFAQRILEFTSGMDRVAFENDLKTQAAVLYQMSVLGEAMRRISPEFRELHPEIPYVQIIGMRNKLVHDYDGINIEVVWQVIQKDIPELISLLVIIAPEKSL